MRLSISQGWFLDQKDRKILLRGVNLGGSTKIPLVPDGATHLHQNTLEHRSVSFVGRPFPLNEADEHFSRLRHWGFNCLRFLTTWEAVEHAGPGMYDEEYLDYLHAVVKKAGDYGLYVFIDPHQDVWSRMSGGDGAPGWTLEEVGFDLDNLDSSEAAVCMAPRYPNYPNMIWTTNNRRLASATMFTLFFASERFAPGCKIAGESAQSYLQRHFIQAMQKVAERLSGFDHVLGFDSLNEPTPGFIGIPKLSEPFPFKVEAPLMSGFDAMLIPAGYTRELPQMQMDGFKPYIDGKAILNPEGRSAWQSPERDIWRNHGVWEVGEDGKPYLLQDDYFAGVRFFDQFVQPFVNRFAKAIRDVQCDMIIFVEGKPGSLEPFHLSEDVAVVNASHWYDIATLFGNEFHPEVGYDWFEQKNIQGVEAVRDSYCKQIGSLVALSKQTLKGCPTLVGEFGLPFNIKNARSYEDGDFSLHEQALSAYYDAIDRNLVHSTIWNYTADNDNQWGDRWNGEDLSIFSRDQQVNMDDPNSGGRAVAGFCRPYVQACAGTPLRQRFERESGEFVLEIDAEPDLIAATRIYVPQLQYADGLYASVTSGTVDYDPFAQEIIWLCHETGRQTLTVSRNTD